MIRIAICQPVLPHFRVPVFDVLGAQPDVAKPPATPAPALAPAVAAAPVDALESLARPGLLPALPPLPAARSGSKPKRSTRFQYISHSVTAQTSPELPTSLRRKART